MSRAPAAPGEAPCSFCADTAAEGCVFCGGTGWLRSEYDPRHDAADDYWPPHPSGHDGAADDDEETAYD